MPGPLVVSASCGAKVELCSQEVHLKDEDAWGVWVGGTVWSGHVRCRLSTLALTASALRLSYCSTHVYPHIVGATSIASWHAIGGNMCCQLTLHHYHYDLAYYCLAYFLYGRLFLFKPPSNGRLPYSLSLTQYSFHAHDLQYPIFDIYCWYH